VLDGLEKALYWMSSFALGADAESLCQLRAPIDGHTFVTESNSLMTMYRVVGSKRFIGEYEYAEQTAALSKVLSGLMRAGNGGRQHSAFFGFRTNPEGGEAVLKKIMAPSLATAKRLGADANFLFLDRLAAMAPHCVQEVAVFGVMTHPGGLSPDERKRWDVYRAEQFKKFSKAGFILDGTITQVPTSPMPVLYSRHQAALLTVEEKMTLEGEGVKVMLDRLSCGEAASVMRQFLDASSYQPDWRPHLLGSRPAAGVVERSTKTFDLGLPMRIGRQLVTEKITEIFGDAELVKRGKLWYGSITLDVCPTEDVPMGFIALTRSIGGMVPYQVHFDLAPNGLDFNRMDKAFAALMGGAGDHNKMVKKAFDELTAMKAANEHIVAVRAVFTTWASNESKCVDNLSFLKSKVEGWGQTVATNESGSPAHVFAASAPGFARTIPAKYLPGPLSEIASLLPVFSPSSVWDTGQLTLFTQEGRPYPILLGSPIQNYWGTLVFAPTGSGKSFLMNMLNAGVLFTPGATRLPMVTIIDKGPSAKGVVELAKAILPPHLAAQVVYWRPTASDIKYCVNPFDTQPGCDRPMDSDRDFLMALLGGMASNLGPEGGKFLGRVIDVAYEMFSRLSPTAKRWQWNTDVELSQKLASVGIEFTEEKPPRVYDVVDAFFAAGMIDESASAQYHAVPLLGDLTRVVQDRRVMSVYGTAPSPSGELIVKVFERNIISAASEYKLFSGITRHRANARFTVVDIDGIASSSQSEEGRRRFGLMMLFARRMGARQFFLHPNEIADVCPPLYLAYNMDRAQKNQEELKFLEYDEIHNAKGIESVQNLIQKDAREGRKYNVVGILSSQDLDDFPIDLVKNCYNFFVLGAGSAQAARDLRDTFDMTESEMRTVMTSCTKPGVLFGMFRTNRGMLSQLLFTKPGSREIWAYNTSAVDMALRNALYDQIGVRRTLAFLAYKFPGGSARNYINDLRNNMSAAASADDSMTTMTIERLRPELVAFERIT